MRLHPVTGLLLSLALLPPVAHAGSDAVRVSARVDSVGLFKNGIALVRRSATLPGDGRFELEDLPVPVHGTFWIESDAHVAARATQRSVAAPADARPSGRIEADVTGGRVTIFLKDGSLPAISGTVVEQRDAGSGNLVVDTEEGRIYLDPSMIAYLRVDEEGPPAPPVMKEVQVVELIVSGNDDRPARVLITYLTHGLAWMPSYRVDVTDASLVTIEQKAIIKDELMDLEDVEVELISGFPNIEFANVMSPLARQAAMATFFGQLSQSTMPQGRLANVMTQQAITSNYAAPGHGAAGHVLPSAEGVDMHYHAIGRHDLRKGDALMLSVARATTEYERIVEWVIPDTRNEWGQVIDEWRRQQDPDRYRNEPWDALRFVNPFDFPMTTAPAMIVAAGRVNGQQTSTWVNPGEETMLPITKALSVRTRSTELEEPGDRAIRRIGGRNFREPIVSGEVLVCNHRTETITVVIRRQFSGDLIETDGNPEKRLRESGVYSVNQRNELIWTLTLEPGETRTMEYRYSVLVQH